MIYLIGVWSSQSTHDPFSPFPLTKTPVRNIRNTKQPEEMIRYPPLNIIQWAALARADSWCDMR
jgi:hypothetical protein